jgi:hypothetical protein
MTNRKQIIPPKRLGLTAHLFEKFKEKTLIRTTKKESI